MLFGSWAWVTLVEFFDFHHSFKLISFFRSFLCLSLGESDRNEPKNEKESQPFLPEKRCQKRVCAFTVEHLDIC